jgi:hypothetical protein
MGMALSLSVRLKRPWTSCTGTGLAFVGLSATSDFSRVNTNRASTYGERDGVCGVSDNIMLGKLCPVGTGSFDILINESMLKVGETKLIWKIGERKRLTIAHRIVGVGRSQCGDGRQLRRRKSDKLSGVVRRLTHLLARPREQLLPQHGLLTERRQRIHTRPVRRIGQGERHAIDVASLCQHHQQTGHLPRLLSPLSDVLPNVSRLLSPLSDVLPNVSRLLSPLSGVLSHVSRLLSPLSGVLSHVSRLLSPLSDVLPHVSRLLSPLSDVLPHVSHLLSHVARLLSHVTRLLPHVSRLLSPLSDVLPHVSRLLSPLSDVLPHISRLLSPLSGVLSHVSCLLPPLSDVLSHGVLTHAGV